MAAPTAEDVRTLQAVASAAQRGALAEAFILARQALAQGLDHPLLRKLSGFAHEQAGRTEEAIADFTAALSETPNDHALRSVLALCLARSGRPAEGLIEADAAVEGAPNLAAAHANRGWVLEALGEVRAAEVAYRRVIQLEPANVAALANLATLAVRRGDPAVGRPLAMEALAIDPSHSVANLALASADLADGRAEAAEARARGLTEAGAAPPHECYAALGVLGDALDRLDRPAEAFAAYAAANRGLDQLYGSRLKAGPGGLALIEAMVAQLEAMPASRWVRLSPYGPPAQRHVFLLGFPRSGTTLMGQVLQAHSDIVVLDERENLADALPAFLAPADGLARLAKADEAELDRHRTLYWNRVRQSGTDPSGRVFVDKLPMNSLALPLISRLFPLARVIFARRDPRDVVLSCFRHRFVLGPTTAEFLDLERTARLFDAVMRMADLTEARLGMAWRVQHYEKLTIDFEGEVRSLCAAIGVDYQRTMADFAARSKSSNIATPSAGQIARGLYTDGAGQWRRYREALAPVLPILTPWVERFGYAAE